MLKEFPLHISPRLASMPFLLYIIQELVCQKKFCRQSLSILELVLVCGRQGNPTLQHPTWAVEPGARQGGYSCRHAQVQVQMANLSPHEQSPCWSAQRNQKQKPQWQSGALSQQLQDQGCGCQEEMRKGKVRGEAQHRSNISTSLPPTAG